MFSLISAWINDWKNNREAGDLRRYRAHYDVTVMDTHMFPTIHFCTVSSSLVVSECHDRRRSQFKSKLEYITTWIRLCESGNHTCFNLSICTAKLKKRKRCLPLNTAESWSILRTYKWSVNRYFEINISGGCIPWIWVTNSAKYSMVADRKSYFYVRAGTSVADGPPQHTTHPGRKWDIDHRAKLRECKYSETCLSRPPLW